METEDSDPKVSNIEGAGEEDKGVSSSADPAAAGAAAAESADDPEHAAAAAAEVSSVASTDSSAGSKSSPFHGFSSQVTLYILCKCHRIIMY